MISYQAPKLSGEWPRSYLLNGETASQLSSSAVNGHVAVWLLTPVAVVPTGVASATYWPLERPAQCGQRLSALNLVKTLQAMQNAGPEDVAGAAIAAAGGGPMIFSRIAA